MLILMNLVLDHRTTLFSIITIFTCYFFSLIPFDTFLYFIQFFPLISITFLFVGFLTFNYIRYLVLFFSFEISISSIILYKRILLENFQQADFFYTLLPYFYYDISYHSFVDSFSSILICLTCILITLCFILVIYHVDFSEISFILFTIELFLVNSFTQVNFVQFYIYFESVLIPMFLLVGVWGSFERKIIAAYKLFFYTLFGSLLLLLLLLSIFSNLSAFDYYEMLLFNFSENDSFVAFIVFIIAFGIKIPIFPLHTWLPEAHGEASTVGSILLAGILLKLGGYAIIRFMLILFSNIFYYFQPFIYFICLLGIFYTSFSAIQQIDMKRIIAYSSISHMSIVVVSISTMNVTGLIGSYYTMIGHGITSTFLFFIAGCIYSRLSTKSIYYFSNLSTSVPLISIFYFFSTVANMSFPGTVGFICEIASMFGICVDSRCIGFFSISSSFLTVVNSIWTFTRIVFSTDKNISTTKFKQFFDLTLVEFYVASIFCFFLFFFGFFPNFLLSNFEIQANYTIADIIEIKQSTNIIDKIYKVKET